MKPRANGWIITLVLLALTACGGRTLVESDLRIKGAPDWVNEGTQVVDDRRGRLLHGVGMAPPMGDASLQRSVADDRARAEIARILSSRLQVISRDYLTASGQGEDRRLEQSISRDIENLTRLNLAGARIVARWKDKRSGDVYSLAELDTRAVKAMMDNVQTMNQDFLRYLQDNAGRLFETR